MMTVDLSRFAAPESTPFDRDASIRHALEELGWSVSTAPLKNAAHRDVGGIVWYFSGAIILYPVDGLCSGADLAGCRTHDDVRREVRKLIAERTPKAEPEPAYKYEPCEVAIDFVSSPPAPTPDATKRPWGPPPGPKPIDPPRAHCPRCYGPARPAYTGLFSHEPLRCERVGGCLAEREVPAESYGDDQTQEGVFEVRMTDGYEPAWTFDALDASGEVGGIFATRDLAVAAWREAAIAKALEEAIAEGRIVVQKREPKYSVWNRGGL